MVYQVSTQDMSVATNSDCYFLVLQHLATLPAGLTDIGNNVFLHYSAMKTISTVIDPGHNIMATLTVTARGQVTFRKDVLQHLGIRPGDKIELDLLPDGRGVLKAARPAGTIASFVGLLAGRTQKVATIEEINEAAAQGWAGKT